MKQKVSRRRAGKFIADAAVYAILIVSSLVMAYPLIFGLLGSLATREDYFRTPWLPVPQVPTLNNYAALLDSQRTPIVLWTGNTLIRAGWYIIIPGVVAVTVGYALAKLRFRGRETVFTYILSSLVFPSIVFNIAIFVMMARWPLAGGNNMLGQGGTGFLNQWPALLLPSLVNAYFIFLFRQTYLSFPADFEEAARVDGAGTARCIFTIYLPMLKPVLTVFVIFQFVAMWNDYVWPLLVSQDNEEIWVLSLAFQFLTGTRNLTGSPSNVAFSPFSLAAAMVATLPLIVLYLALQNYFVEGVQGFALKG